MCGNSILLHKKCKSNITCAYYMFTYALDRRIGNSTQQIGCGRGGAQRDGNFAGCVRLSAAARIDGGCQVSDWKLAYHANCWGPLGGDAVGVTSITRLGYRTFGDMDRALSEIAAAGYEGVELFDGNLLDYSAAEFRKLLDNTGLALVGTYAGGNFIFDDILPEELARVTRAAAAAGGVLRRT